MIKIQIYPVTMLQTNCCYLVDDATGKSAVSDPGEQSKSLEAQIQKDGGKLDYVLLTLRQAARRQIRRQNCHRQTQRTVFEGYPPQRHPSPQYPVYAL